MTAHLRVALIAALLSGGPSTVHALATGRDPLKAVAAAGTLILPDERSERELILAGLTAHLALSLWWAFLIGFFLPRRRRVLAGAVYGLAIAAFDLGVVARRYPRIQALKAGPQVADHVLFGILVGIFTPNALDV